jgi:hypothetical protein
VCVDGSPVSVAGSCPQTSWSLVLTAAGCTPTGTDCYVVSRVNSSSGVAVAENPQLLAVPGLLAFPAADVTAQIAAVPNADGSINVTLVSSASALFVTLTTAAAGRFDPNVIMMTGARSIVSRFIPFAASSLDITQLSETLRIDHVAEYSTRQLSAL